MVVCNNIIGQRHDIRSSDPKVSTYLRHLCYNRSNNDNTITQTRDNIEVCTWTRAGIDRGALELVHHENRRSSRVIEICGRHIFDNNY